MRKNDDLISRQDALSFLRNWERVKDYSWGERNIIKATINEIESLPSAQSETHEERTETHACDLISRQDFDKFLKDAEKEAAKYRKYVFASALNTIRGNLRNFPSTQPKSEERKAESAQNVPKEDLISRNAAIDALMEIIDRPNHADFLYTDEICKALNELPSAQPEIVRCKDCENWIPGYITDNDDFIPPKCGKYQQMVGHSSDDYCSLAERRTDEGD